MSTIVTRAGKGSPLTNNEVDSNFINLNSDKVETVTSVDGSVVLSRVGTTVDFSVGINASTGNLIAAVRNETGATLTKGTVVYPAGASGNKMLVQKALANSDATSAQTYGMIQADIPNNQNGFVVISGLVSGLNTSGLVEGGILYLSPTTAGGYTQTKPSAPNHLVYVGIVTRVHATQGDIQTRIQNGYELDEIHDVQITSIANNDILQYDSATSLWKNVTPATARTNLGLAIGTNVQAWDVHLDQIAALNPTADNFIVGNGTSWILETPAQARASLGAVSSAGDTMTGKLNLPVVTTSAAPINIGMGATNTAPTSPISGDIWINAANNLSVQIGAATLQVAFLNMPSTWSTAQTFDNTINASGNISLTGSSNSNTALGTAATTGTTTIGGTGQTGALIFGRSISSQTTSIQAGATTSGNTKTINFGTGGLSGSTTTITIGSTNGTTTTANGTWTFSGSQQVNSLGVGTAASGTAGEIRATNNITAYFSSDIKFKENVTPITGATEIVKAIGADYFDWTDAYIAERGGEDGYFVQKHDFGVIAQKVQAVFPKAVRTRPDGSLAVDYEKLGVLAFAALIEQDERIAKLEALVAKLANQKDSI